MSAFLRSFDSMDSYRLKWIGGAFLAGSVLSIGVWIARRRRQKAPQKENPRDTVILHQIGRGPYVPSLTPFAVKLETFLRMTKVSYENVHDFKRSPKGKFPWIEYNNEVVSDSGFCLEFIKKKCNVDPDAHLTSAQRATARAFQKMVEENTYWTWALERWVYDKDKTRLWPSGWGSYRVTYWAPRLVRNQAYQQGIGRHTREEVLSIMEGDLRAISDFLGDKAFLMGDRPSEVDCAVFGQLVEMEYQCPDSVLDLLAQFPNLHQYSDRMKETFWPDWEDCTTRGGTQEAKA